MKNLHATGAALLMMVLVAVMVCCTTFPAPKTPGDTLLLLREEFSKEIDDPTFGHYRLTISDSSGKEVRTIDLSNSNRTRTITGIPRGAYRISQQQFVYDNGEESPKRAIGIPFSLMAGMITFLDVKAVVRIFNPMNMSTGYHTVLQFERMSLDEQRAILDGYRLEENFAAWQLPLVLK